MSDKPTYDIYFHCGASIRNVQEPVLPDTVLCVYSNDGATIMRPQNENSTPRNCLACQCKRASGRKEILFYTEMDKQTSRRPTGKAVYCKVYIVRPGKLLFLKGGKE